MAKSEAMEIDFEKYAKQMGKGEVELAQFIIQFLIMKHVVLGDDKVAFSWGVKE